MQNFILKTINILSYRPSTNLMVYLQYGKKREFLRKTSFHQIDFLIKLENDEDYIVVFCILDLKMWYNIPHKSVYTCLYLEQQKS